MLSRVFRFLNSFLYGPAVFCAGLIVFLTTLFFLTDYLVYVDVNGNHLHPTAKKFEEVPPKTREMLDLASDLNWKKDPAKRTRVDELFNNITDPDTPKEAVKPIQAYPAGRN